MTVNDEIYKEIAESKNISKHQVEEVCRSMFDFVYETIESGSLKAIRLPYFVLIWCKPYRLKRLKERGML